MQWRPGSRIATGENDAEFGSVGRDTSPEESVSIRCRTEFYFSNGSHGDRKGLSGDRTARQLSLGDAALRSRLLEIHEGAAPACLPRPYGRKARHRSQEASDDGHSARTGAR